MGPDGNSSIPCPCSLCDRPFASESDCLQLSGFQRQGWDVDQCVTVAPPTPILCSNKRWHQRFLRMPYNLHPCGECVPYPPPQSLMPILHPAGTKGPSWSSRAPWRTGEACVHCLVSLFLSLLGTSLFHGLRFSGAAEQGHGTPPPPSAPPLTQSATLSWKSLCLYCPAQPRAGRSPWTLVRAMNSWPVPGDVRRYYPFHLPRGLQEFWSPGPTQTAVLPGDSQPGLFCAFLF